MRLFNSGFLFLVGRSCSNVPRQQLPSVSFCHLLGSANVSAFNSKKNHILITTTNCISDKLSVDSCLSPFSFLFNMTFINSQCQKASFWFLIIYETKHETDTGRENTFCSQRTKLQDVLMRREWRLCQEHQGSHPMNHAQKLSSFHELMDCNCCF